jgi:hypothetical protein
VAEAAGSFVYELLTGIGPRVARRYLGPERGRDQASAPFASGRLGSSMDEGATTARPAP